MPQKAEKLENWGLQNILGMHHDEWYKERRLESLENMLFAFNEKHSHTG